MSRNVPGLGEVRGLSDIPDCPNVEQYRGIPYGSISARFRQAKIVSSWPDGKWNGTKYGPICPFPRMVIGGSIVQKPLPAQHDYDMNEFTCLNLNITCPKALPPTGGYPVAVWVHGGGNVVGCGSATDYNAKYMVNFSVEQNLPVVSVTINYRLGAFGFLASEAIRDDNEKSGDGGAGNYGIRDQLLAYQWVKDHISAFSGDPNRITAHGESAGAIDTHILLCSTTSASVPFNQVILQSGAAPLTIRTMSHQQTIYDKLLAQFNITSSTASTSQLEALRTVPADDLVKGYICLGSPVSSWQATVDGYFLSDMIKFSEIPSISYPKHVKRLLIGDCANEGLIFVEKVKKMQWTFEKLQPLAVSILGEANARKVFEAFGITSDALPEALLAGLVQLLTDAEWSQPVESIAKSFSNGEVFYYHVAEGNPFDGPNKGLAHHAVDLLYIFLTYQSELPADLRSLAEILTRYWLLFMHGDSPWEAYDQNNATSGTIMYFGPEAKVAAGPEQLKPAYKTLRLCEELQNDVSTFAAAVRGEVIVK